MNFERTPSRLKSILVTTGFYTGVEPLQDVLVRDVRGPLYLLWAAALAVLAIGVGNLGSLALARSRARLNELGTRLAIGASTVRHRSSAPRRRIAGCTRRCRRRAGARRVVAVGDAVARARRGSAPHRRRRRRGHVRTRCDRGDRDRSCLSVPPLHHATRRDAARGLAKRHARPDPSSDAAGPIVAQMACSFMLLTGSACSGSAFAISWRWTPDSDRERAGWRHQPACSALRRR